MITCKHAAHRIPDFDTRAEVILPECAGHTEWLQARTSGIGGSEIGALLGISPYSTPFDVYRAKMGQAPDLSGNPHIQAGHDFEDAVARITARKVGMVSRPAGGLWRHPDHEFALVTPDRLATKPRKWKAEGLIECKTAASSDGWSNGDAPLAYVAQVQWQLGILGLEKGWLGCQIFNQQKEFVVREITFDPVWFAEMIDCAETFWTKHVLAEEPPMLDYHHPHTAELVADLHPIVVRPSAELPDGSEEWIEAYHELKAQEKAITKELDGIKNWIKMTLGDAAAGYLGDHKVVSLPEVSTTRVDVEKLRENYPEAAAECEVTSTHRRLTVSKLPKEGK